MTNDFYQPLEQEDYIERRASARKLLVLPVSLYYDGLGLLSCKTLNLGTGGMLLDTGQVRLSTGVRVEIVMTDLTRNYNNPIRIRAWVGRVNDAMAAVCFHDLEMDAFRRLKALLAEPASNH